MIFNDIIGSKWQQLNKLFGLKKIKKDSLYLPALQTPAFGEMFSVLSQGIICCFVQDRALRVCTYSASSSSDTEMELEHETNDFGTGGEMLVDLMKNNKQGTVPFVHGNVLIPLLLWQVNFSHHF